MEHQQLTSTQSSHGFSDELNSSIARRVQFTDAKEEYEPCSDCSSGDETPSGDETLSVESNQVDEVWNCLGKRVPSGPTRMVCPRSRCQDNRGTEFCPGSRET